MRFLGFLDTFGTLSRYRSNDSRAIASARNTDRLYYGGNRSYYYIINLFDLKLSCFTPPFTRGRFLGNLNPYCCAWFIYLGLSGN